MTWVIWGWYVTGVIATGAWVTLARRRLAPIHILAEVVFVAFGGLFGVFAAMGVYREWEEMRK